jgi:hypothetical protein
MSNIDNTTKLIWKYAIPDTDEKPLLSILICSLFERELFLSTLYEEFKKQIGNQMANVELVVLITDKTISIGEKRNWLLNKANGEYLCFFDDDDMPTPNYIQLLVKALQGKPDCCSLKGIITFDGQNPEVFEHSIKYKEWKTTSNDNPKYERPPNHLNAIKSEIAKRFEFPEINHGEDSHWSEAIFKSGLIQTESYIGEVLYNYLYISKK